MYGIGGGIHGFTRAAHGGRAEIRWMCASGCDIQVAGRADLAPEPEPAVPAQPPQPPIDGSELQAKAARARAALAELEGDGDD